MAKFEILKALDLGVKSIIDVGVQRGTPDLYAAFPECDFLLVDPQPGGASLLHRPPASYKFVNVALGRERGRLVLDERGPRSSLQTWNPKAPHGSQGTHEVDVITLDQFLAEQQPEGPLGLKLDTEGHELEVLAGLTSRLDEFAFVACETNIRDRFVGGYRFADLIAALSAKGFDFYNFLDDHQERPVFYDCAFLPKASQWFGIGKIGH